MRWARLAATIPLTFVFGCGGTVSGDPRVNPPVDPGARGALDAGAGSTSSRRGPGDKSPRDGGTTSDASGAIDECQPVHQAHEDVNTGHCAPTALPDPLGERCACRASPGAPGPEGCPPSSAASHGAACCTQESCGFDFGQGCTLEPLDLPNSPGLAERPACAAASGGPPELLAIGHFGGASANASAVYLAEFGSESVITRVSKADCSTREVYRSSSEITAFAATDTVLYVLAATSTGAQELVRYPDDGAAGTPVPLATLGTSNCIVAALGSDASSAYVIVECPRTDADAEDSGNAVLELPCCNGAVKTLAYGPVFGLPPARPLQVFRDGDGVVWRACASAPDVGPLCSVGELFGQRGQASLIFEETHQSLSPFLATGGRLYFGQGSRVMEVDPTDCGTRAAIDDRPATITALAARDGDLYWAEHSRGLTFSEIIMMPMTGNSAGLEIATTEGDVSFLSVDATHVYWLTQGDKTSRLVRAPRP